MLPLIDGEKLSRLLPMDVAIDALEKAFMAGKLPDAPQRSHLETAAGDLLIMPASDERGVGVKVVTVGASNPGRGLPLIHAVYVLFDGETLAPRALIDGSALTALRTSAVSAVATRYLARPEAERLVLFGAGVQGRAHLEAMRAVRPLTAVGVVSRTLGPAERLAERVAESGLPAEVTTPEAVADADLVCTCTTSPEPVFDGSLLRPGTHVNAIGAYRPDQREVDDEAVRRARVVVETREVALAEAGDLVIPIGAGVVGPSHIAADLSEVVQGAPVRTGPEDITLFKSVGVAFEDLVVAQAAVDRLGPGRGREEGPA